MPRRYSRRPYRKYSRRPRKPRRRFSKKKFSRRSTVNKTRVNTLTIGKLANVKLTYTKEWSATVTAPDLWASVTQPSGARTYPIAAETASIVFLGSHFCTPMGSATSVPPIVEDYPSGLVDWATFYDEAICYGSSINIQIAPAPGTQTGLSRYVLLPIAANSPRDAERPNDLITTTRAELDALDYGDLSSYPGAQSGYIKNIAAGNTYIKSFRKTKQMLGMKDITDNQADLRMILPKAATINIGDNNPSDSATTIAWIWYLRIFNLDAATSSPYFFTVRLKYYTQLQTRGLILQETANE